MAQESNTSKALGRDQVMLLLDLIVKRKVLTTRATNATNNKLKEEAWASLAQEFSAMAGELRRPDQLRLKWENLKKASRKRNALIRQNNLKTGGGKSYIPPDDALDRVASLLGATCSGYTVEFGGDAAPAPNLPQSPEAVVELIDFGPLPDIPGPISNILSYSGGGDDSGVNGGGDNSGFINGEPAISRASKHFIFNTPKSSSLKRRKLSKEMQRARRDKDLALARYFEAKARKVELENIKLELQIKQINS